MSVTNGIVQVAVNIVHNSQSVTWSLSYVASMVLEGDSTVTSIRILTHAQ